MNEFFANYGMMLVWLAVSILIPAIEAVTSDMVTIWFWPGALVALILSIWVKIFWVQMLVFFALSVICLLIVHAYFKKHPRKKESGALNADSVIGKQGIVTEPINNLQGTGAVKVGGLVWTARSANGDEIASETVVEITEISGVKLFCRPANPISSYHQSN